MILSPHPSPARKGRRPGCAAGERDSSLSPARQEDLADAVEMEVVRAVKRVKRLAIPKQFRQSGFAEALASPRGPRERGTEVTPDTQEHRPVFHMEIQAICAANKHVLWWNCHGDRGSGNYEAPSTR